MSCANGETVSEVYDITCPVCFEPYIEPKSLSCGHSLCENCVKRLSFSTTVPVPRYGGSPNNGFGGMDITFDRHTRIQCPQCRALMIVPSGGVPTNYQLKELLTRLEKKKENEKTSESQLCINSVKMDPQANSVTSRLKTLKLLAEYRRNEEGINRRKREARKLESHVKLKEDNISESWLAAFTVVIVLKFIGFLVPLCPMIDFYWICANTDPTPFELFRIHPFSRTTCQILFCIIFVGYVHIMYSFLVIFECGVDRCRFSWIYKCSSIILLLFLLLIFFLLYNFLVIGCPSTQPQQHDHIDNNCQLKTYEKVVNANTLFKCYELIKSKKIECQQTTCLMRKENNMNFTNLTDCDSITDSCWEANVVYMCTQSVWSCICAFSVIVLTTVSIVIGSLI